MADWISKKSDPLEVFQTWYKDALSKTSFEPTKMVLATTSVEGWPAARMVLLKQVDERGFAFFSNYNSQKGEELANNPKAALLFHWELPEHRQVRVQGTVEKMAPDESEEYFRTRHRGSQIGAWASHQSEEIADRNQLVQAVKEIEQKFEGKPIPCPDFWGGYRLSPKVYEFWQAGEDRLHDRMIFKKNDQDQCWETHRRSP